MVTGDSTEAALEPACPLPGSPMSCASGYSCSLGIQAARVPLPMALDLSRQLPVQLVVTPFPWQGHPLAQPVPWF